MFRLIGAPALAGMLCLGAAPVAARGGEVGSVMTVTGDIGGVVRSQRVSLADLDLRHDREVARAQSRVRFASKQVCDSGATFGLHQKRDYGACFSTALSSARSDLDRYVTLVRAD